MSAQTLVKVNECLVKLKSEAMVPGPSPVDISSEVPVWQEAEAQTSLEEPPNHWEFMNACAESLMNSSFDLRQDLEPGVAKGSNLEI